MNQSDLMDQLNGRFDADPKIEHYFSDGLYAKRFFVPKGFAVGQHSHNYSHLSILAKGKVVVKTDEYEKEFVAPECIEIVSNVHHTIYALEDCEWFCIHATSEKEVDKIDQVLIKGV